MTAKTSRERIAEMRQKAKQKGWKRREYYATEEEHQKIKETLQQLRSHQ